MSDRGVLVVAPHLVYPARNGSDISIDRIARGLSRSRPFVDLVAMDRVIRFEQGAVSSERRFANRHRGKRTAAVRALLGNGHFLGEKFLTNRFLAEVSTLRKGEYDAVLYSYIVTTSIRSLLDVSGPSLVWTHNDQFKWFRDLQSDTKRRLTRRVARNTENWLRSHLQSNRDLVLLTVTEQDRSGFLGQIDMLDIRVIPIGVDVPPESVVRESSGPVKLVFAGALGVGMNLDALQHFRTTYYDAIMSAAGDTTVTVAGSNPSGSLLEFCRSEGWDVRRDLSDEEMTDLLAGATFTLLPFPYATGAKLKLLISLAHGTPVLATSVSASEVAHQPPSLVSDDPHVWRDRVADARASGIPRAARLALRESVIPFSWERSASLLNDLIDSKSTADRSD